MLHLDLCGITVAAAYPAGEPAKPSLSRRTGGERRSRLRVAGLYLSDIEAR
jgi:hypothetical protein